MNSPAQPNKFRPIRSYVVRSRLTDSQRETLAQHSAEYIIPFASAGNPASTHSGTAAGTGSSTSTDTRASTSPGTAAGISQPLAEYFPHAAPLVVEIGFGYGTVLLALAQQQPQRNFLGIEVYPPGIAALLAELARHRLRNVKVIRHDAAEVFAQLLAPESLDKVLMLFPDPWPKKRHHKRRLVQPEFMTLVSSRLQPRWADSPGHRLAALCRTYAAGDGRNPAAKKSQRPRDLFGSCQPFSPRSQRK